MEFSQESKHGEAEDEQASKVCKTSGGKNLSAPVVLRVSAWVGIVEVVVRLLVVDKQVRPPRCGVWGKRVLITAVTHIVTSHRTTNTPWMTRREALNHAVRRHSERRGT